MRSALLLLPIILLASPRTRVQGQSADTLALASVVTAPPLLRGTRARAGAGPRRIAGRLLRTAGDTLVLATGPAGRLPRAIVVSAGTRLEIHGGRASRWRGAAIGAACGVLAGALVGLSISDAVGGNAGDGLWVGGQLLPYTIPVGAVAGALLPFDRWARVRVTAR